MAITLVTALGISWAGSGGTTPPQNTIGATGLLVSVSSYGGGSALAVSDNKGNSYLGLTARSTANAAHRFFHCLAPTTVGAGHTWTIIGTNIYPAVVVWAFADVVSYQIESGATALGGASLASGNVTPSAPGALILTGVAGQNGSTDTVTPPGFTVTSVPYVAGVNMQGSAAWRVQGAAAAIDPTWAFSPAQGNIAVGTAVFLPAAVAAVERAESFVWGPL